MFFCSWLNWIWTNHRETVSISDWLLSSVKKQTSLIPARPVHHDQITCSVGPVVLAQAFTCTYLLPSFSPSSSELMSIINMSSSSENSSPLSSLLPPPPPVSGRTFLLLFLLFLLIPPSPCCSPMLWTGSELQGMGSACMLVKKWHQMVGVKKKKKWNRVF